MERIRGIRRGGRLALGLVGVGSTLGFTGFMVGGQATTAFADSQAYELYCPGTPVGNIALNDVVTTATITSSGSTFNVTNYQTTVNLPAAIASAAAALGNSSVTGTATATLNVTGGTPATKQSPTLQINTPIPSPVPAAGLTLKLPDPATTIGPFTATGGAITVSQASQAALTLVVSGNNLSLNCTAYANNAITPSGITASKPTGAAVTPQIATSSGGGGGGGPTTTAASTATTAAPTATTAAPATAPGGNLAYTGAGPGVFLLAEVGAGGLIAAGILLFGYRARLLFVSASKGRSRRDSGS